MTEKCKACRKTVSDNMKSICCDVCNKWFHFKCSKLSEKDFTFHSDNEFEFWRCSYCIIYKCSLCELLIPPKGACIECNLCKNWIHQRCSGFNKKEFKNLGSIDNWYCKKCIQGCFPFSSLNRSSFLKTNQKSIAPAKDLNEKEIKICRICEKTNNRSDTAVFCKNCQHLCHKKCTKINKKTTDFCLTCLSETFPLQNLSNTEIENSVFNSCKLCIHTKISDHCIHSNPCQLAKDEVLPFENNFFNDHITSIFSDFNDNHSNLNDKSLLSNINFKYFLVMISTMRLQKKILNSAFSTQT